MMNEGKIFLVNVSKGRIGEDNSGLLGGMIITKIQLAAMERVRIPEENRRDFYLYVDEFQNFVTDAFAGILSEARKYRLNLTVAHQYTAQLVVEKSSAVRDAVFGNVGTMIVFRVGSDDAEFLESEFDPEFTPQDIVNLPNYKVYLKLMIDGVTSRPFSAKTLPPMVKSGDKKIEEEVIKSSRALYCRSKEVVEREINDWSGMSLGNDHDGGTGNIEKFPVICSLCKKETTVPFKPDSGRAVYCKDCIAKIKSGEVKVEKGSENQIRHDESTFYKPLADLGIEFQQKDRAKGEEKERYPERIEKSMDKSSVPAGKPGIFGSIKRVLSVPHRPAKSVNVKPVHVPSSGIRENTALRDILNKITADGGTPLKAVVKEPQVSKPKADQAPVETPVSLDSLKNKMKESVTSKPASTRQGGDRAASSEDMNNLKNLILEKIPVQTPAPVPKPQVEIPTPAPVSTPVPKKPKEVPEDVLRKILE